MSSLATKFRSLDIYRKVPTDLTETTTSGATVSLIAMTVIAILFLSELTAFLDVTVRSDINIDVTAHRLACDIVSIDVQDIMGAHILNVGGDLTKQRLKADGSLITGEGSKLSGGHGGHNLDDTAFLTRAKLAVDLKEGCRVYGHLDVQKVPGNFHLSTHAEANIMAMLFNDVGDVDVSHTVNHLSFGDDGELGRVLKYFPNIGQIHPLDGAHQERPADSKDTYLFEYYVKVVPSTFVRLNGETFHVHQFTAHENAIQGRPQVPAVYFRYDLSPVTVGFTEEREGFFRFIVQLCAIVGGVFTVAGMTDGLLWKLQLMQKANAGKLG